MLDKVQITRVNKEVFTKFPYLSGCQPHQKNLPDGVTQLHYSTSTKTASGMQLPINVKVKVSADGNIISISTTK